MRAQLEHPQRLLTVTVAAVAAILIGSELFALLDTALTATPSAPLRNESRVSSDPVITITEAGLFGAAATPIVQSDDAGLPQTSAQRSLILSEPLREALQRLGALFPRRQERVVAQAEFEGNAACAGNLGDQHTGHFLSGGSEPGRHFVGSFQSLFVDTHPP